MEVAFKRLNHRVQSTALVSNKSAAAPNLASNHSQDHSHSCSQLGRRLADSPDSGMLSHAPAYSYRPSRHACYSTFILSIFLDSNYQLNKNRSLYSTFPVR